LLQHLRAAIRAWTGDAEYEQFVRSCEARGEVPLDRGRYLAQRLEEKYSTANRCC
jgi:putative selenoprotein